RFGSRMLMSICSGVHWRMVARFGPTSLPRSPARWQVAHAVSKTFLPRAASPPVMSVSAVIDGEFFSVNEGMGSERAWTWLKGLRLGDAVAQTHWDLPLFSLLRQGGEQAGRAWRSSRPPAVGQAAIGARCGPPR